jgi:two-component system phosphate regulon sensor histidine kinase PhoR
VKRTRLNLIFATIALALAALITVQLAWAINAHQQHKTRQDNKVMEALYFTVKKAREHAACFEIFSKAYIRPGQGFYMMKHPYTPSGGYYSNDSAHADTIPMFFTGKGFYYNTPDNVFEKFNDMRFRNPVSVDITLRFTLRTRDAGFEKESELLLGDLNAKNYRDVFSSRLPVTFYYDTLKLDSMLRVHLADQHITAPYYFGIITAGTDSPAWVQRGAGKAALQASRLSMQLTDDSYFSKPYRIAVYFPNETIYFNQALWFLMASSVLVVIVLLAGFWYFIRTILRQKRLSQVKNDFINNMTHEFNTPVANIALATETLSEMLGSSNEKVHRLLQILQTENQLLRENVERILQAAAFDKGEIRLHPELFELNTMVQKVLAAFEIKFSVSEAQVEFCPWPQPVMLHADETHIINALYNLIDNALKYTRRKPFITILTRVEQDMAIITVTDNGIGMSKEEIKKIFTRFYRVQGGNLHDVKGFGLGLNYLESVINAHQGEIHVKSDKNNGSTFEVRLPLKKQ